MGKLLRDAVLQLCSYTTMFSAIVKCYDTILPLGERIINIPLYFRAVRQSIDSIPFMSEGYTIYGQLQVKYP